MHIARIITAIIETPARMRAQRLSAAHKARRMQRLEREAIEHVNAQISKALRDKTPYPFHA